MILCVFILFCCQSFRIIMILCKKVCFDHTHCLWLLIINSIKLIYSEFNFSQCSLLLLICGKKQKTPCVIYGKSDFDSIESLFRKNELNTEIRSFLISCKIFHLICRYLYFFDSLFLIFFLLNHYQVLSVTTILVICFLFK